jgi:hypothetical protein
MRLPRVDRDARSFINQMGNIRNGHHRRWAAELKGQMAFAMGMGAHRLVEPVDGYAAERAMTDRQSGTHRLTPNTHIIVCLPD